LAKDHPQIARRLGIRTIFDFNLIDELFAGLPTVAERPAHQQENLRKARAAWREKRAARAAAKAEAAAAQA
jgi:hypothetical protein